ncbi:MAG: large-conductance mechanosensitive channel protein MscL [Candidatus Pacebacteria bacterium]|nr:large-conductance mechanosensitive channel protein MscL [Candidatus Paceibacterota bacterium]MBP9840051.1 large-conductance mechanosensitive channel protein MscL [Candidatus Paceibacterota bacterium]
MLQEFKAFAMRGNVIDLAIGVIIGTAFGKIVSSLVDDIIMPPIGFLIGGIDFSSLSVPMGSASLNYGIFIQAVVNFAIIAFALFMLLRTLNRLMHQKKKEEEAATPVESEELRVLREIRDSLKRSA